MPAALCFEQGLAAFALLRRRKEDYGLLARFPS
jgi:hypothetical protein